MAVEAAKCLPPDKFQPTSKTCFPSFHLFGEDDGNEGK